jgi:dihydrodipicolinate synthase
MKAIEGVVTALLTPFDRTGEVDYQSTAQLINHVLGAGVDGLFILGTNGESASLSYDEKVEFARFVMKEVSGRVPVIIGVGECGTSLTLRLIQALSNLSPYAYSVICPYFQRLNEEELYQHFLTISQASDIPVLLYNMPKLTGNPITLSLYRRLVRIENIIGIKDSSGIEEELRNFIKETPSDKSVYVGSDSLFLLARQSGARGGVSGLSNAIAPIFVELNQVFEDGNITQSLILQEKINDFRLKMKKGTAPAMIKATLAQDGIIQAYTRLPISSILIN